MLTFEICLVAFLYGIFIGSMLNVLILRIPLKEKLTNTSRCPACDHKLMWYDMIPVLSYIFLGGKCRYCRDKISVQYPLIELLNGICYMVLYLVSGIHIETFLYCLCISTIIVSGTLSYKKEKVPEQLYLFILFIGLIRMATDYRHFSAYLIGSFAVSGLLFLLYIISKKKIIELGDIKLIAATGLLLGWRRIVAGFLAGCVFATIEYVVRLETKKQRPVFTLYPFLCVGIYITMLWGEQLVGWYLSMMGL